MTLVTILLFVPLWSMILLHIRDAFQTLCRTVRFRDAMVELDADRIAGQSFQPAISLVVRCDLGRSTDQLFKIQRLMALNYTRFEVVVITDSAGGPDAFAALVEGFEMLAVPPSEALKALRYPVREVYRSISPLYRRLILVDKPFLPDDDLRDTGAAAGRAEAMVFVPSIDNRLPDNSLACLAIMEMRDPGRQVARVRAAARYEWHGSLFRNFFRIMADLCNLRRIYVGGSAVGDDFGQFIVLADTTGRAGREEYVPDPQMFLHRPSTIDTYLHQLMPGMTFRSTRGRLDGAMELTITIVFWATALHAILRPQDIADAGYLMLGVLMLPLLSSVYAIFIGEAILRSRHYSVGRIGILLLMSVVEAAVFCLLKPWGWLISHFRRRS